ncbi:hypothetical protein ACHAXM_008853 [Skeletonema potamos]
MVAADTKAPQGAVLYIDHARHLTPLTLTYHATASRHLTSGRSDVIPPSTSVEVETAYCPRCLTFCDAASASTSLGVCQKDAGGCKDCPLCFSPASISIDRESSSETHLICHYVCGHCPWSSIDSGVTVSADKLLEYSNNDNIDLKEAEKQRMSAISEITKELENCFQRKVSERNQNGDELFHSIGEMWAKREQDEERRKRVMISSAIINDGNTNEKTTWSLGALEDALVGKKKELNSSGIAGKGVDTKSSPNIEDNSQNEKNRLPTSQQMAAQMSLTITAPRYQNGLLPLPVRYRTRVSRRCRAEQSAGRTGILVKPKLNPLEGDTSLRAGHGQWWKKDSSAVHVVPRVQLCRHGTDPTTGGVAALLKVKNPTLNMIRLRFSGPESVEGENFDTNELENILIDPFTEVTIAKAELCSLDSLSSMDPSDWMELDSAEDLLLDIGKRQDDDPQLVRSWDSAPLLGALDSDSLPKLTIVASRGDTSWVEMILPKPMVMGSDGNKPPSNYFAVPLSMQIEVGNGSWESSLIKRCDVPEHEQDLVRFDFVILLHM